MGRRWSPAPVGKFSPHAGAATHGNGISKLATHPPQHADAPSLQLAAVVLSPFPSHRRGHESAAAFSRSAPRRGAPRRAVCRPAAPAGKFSPHAGALTHRNGISALATHPPLHADVPSLCSWLRWCSFLSFSPARAWEGRGLSLNRPLSLLPGCCHASTWRRGWPWRASRPSRKRCGAGSCPRTKVSSEIAPREHGAWV